VGSGWCAFDVGPETLSVTTLKDLSRDAPVNLERSLRMGGLVGGHLVTGHVDGVGTIRWLKREIDTLRMTIALPGPELARYLIQKGSVAVDGVSLTVAELHDDSSFDVMIIPHTLRVTTLGVASEGTRVNLEMDMIGKYVCRLLTNMGYSKETLGSALRLDPSRRPV
jgi:riboflavin synthase